jgi:hypothetical protein
VQAKSRGVKYGKNGVTIGENGVLAFAPRSTTLRSNVARCHILFSSY